MSGLVDDVRGCTSDGDCRQGMFGIPLLEDGT